MKSLHRGGVCMFPLSQRGFSLGSPASSHSPKHTCKFHSKLTTDMNVSMNGFCLCGLALWQLEWVSRRKWICKRAVMILNWVWTIQSISVEPKNKNMDLEMNLRGSLYALCLWCHCAVKKNSEHRSIRACGSPVYSFKRKSGRHVYNTFLSLLLSILQAPGALQCGDVSVTAYHQGSGWNSLGKSRTHWATWTSAKHVVITQSQTSESHQCFRTVKGATVRFKTKGKNNKILK